MTQTIKIVSFGYKAGGPPKGSTLVLDCRPMANPHCVPRLRPLDGRDPVIQDYVKADKRFPIMLDLALREANTRYQGLGPQIAFGCYGGRHRSAAMAEVTAGILRAAGNTVEVEHRALGK